MDARTQYDLAYQQIRRLSDVENALEDIQLRGFAVHLLRRTERQIYRILAALDHNVVNAARRSMANNVELFVVDSYSNGEWVIKHLKTSKSDLRVAGVIGANRDLCWIDIKRRYDKLKPVDFWD